MAHNQWVEMLTVFGVLGFMIFFALLLRAGWRLSVGGEALTLTRDVRIMFLAVLLLLLGRFVLANGGLYHPASATPLFLCLFASTLARADSDPEVRTPRALGEGVRT
jgi:hypothetical protein